MRSSFAKEIVRSITHSLGRFLAIAVIAALGAGFYAGLRMTGPDMRLAADDYFDGTNLYDIRVVSTMGLSEESARTLADIEGVDEVMLASQADAMAYVGENQCAVSFHSLDVEAASASDTSDGVHARSDEADYVNRPLLVEGTWPQRANECVVCADAVMDHELSIGDTVRVVECLSEVDDVFAVQEYTIVGFVRSSSYACFTNLGSTTLGSGSIDQYVYVTDEAFAEDYPRTEAYLTVSGAKDLDATGEAYEALVDEVRQRVEEAAPGLAAQRLNEIKAEVQAELDEARTDYETERADAQRQLDDAQAELDSAQSQLDSASAQLSASQPELESARSQLESSAATIEASEARLAAGEQEYQDGVAQLAEQRSAADAQFASAQAQIDAQRGQVEEGLAQLDALRGAIAGLEAQMAQLDPASEEYAALAAQVEQLNAQVAQIEGGAAQLEAAQAELDAQWQGAEEQFAAAQSQLDAARAELDAGWAQLSSGRQSYQSGLSQYQSGLREYQSGRSEYEAGVRSLKEGQAEYDEQQADAQRQFADAEQELADAQAEIDDLEEPDVYVLDRSKNVGAASFKSDSQRIDNIAQVFPFIFFLVAALVSLTTMTRMVDEERVLIGTHKALGYSKGRIASKYLIYAAIASGVGGVVGIACFSQFLPWFIQYAYSVTYDVPIGATPVDPGLAAFSAGLSVGITLAATGYAAWSSLRETPAALMLPRTPKAGKRILLERVRPLWGRLSFSWKVTARNIFRYKRRFFMAIIGIAGCTALLLTGLGLQNAINDIIDKQFFDIYDYALNVRTDEDMADEDREALEGLLEGDDRVGDFTVLHAANLIASHEDADERRFELLVPEDLEAFDGYVDVRERVGHKDIALGEGSVVVSEKMASELGIATGDSFTVQEEDTIGNATGQEYQLTVTAVMENYVGDCVVMAAGVYEETFGEAPAPNAYYAKTTADEGARMALVSEIQKIEGVSTASYNDEAVDSYRTMLRSVDSVVVILIVAAAALAFVVLYNLTNINIGEREREIATLKVLGFTPREVNAYIYRETMLLSLIGAIVGMPLGIVMERFVALTAEVDQVMFGRDIHALSFVLAFVLTMVFTAVVMLAMRGKLRKIDMVESLKSIE